MRSHMELLASYVPEFILDRLTSNRWFGAQPAEEECSGAVLFVDISGFTPLCEALTEKGEAGLEEISVILNRYFDHMINLITAYGGAVLHFAGDALVAVWRNTRSDESVIRLTGRAALCAKLLQGSLNRQEVIPDVKLSLRSVIGTGSYKASYVGGLDGRWELFLSGEAVAQIRTYGSSAGNGEVVLSPEAYSFIREYCEIESGREPDKGINLIALTGDWLPEQVASAELNPDSESALLPYLPPSILAAIRAGQADWTAELRNVNVLFIQLSQLLEGISLDRLQQAVRGIQDVLQTQEGTIHKISLDEKGAAVIAAFGLPSLTHENDAFRAIKAALDIQSMLSELSMKNSIGIATGLVFCGSIGNTTRREYTMIGNTMNLAARLMQAADGAILCDEPTYRATVGEIQYQPQGTLQLKGFSAAVQTYRPVEAAKSKTSPRYRHSLVGREAEIRTIERKLDRLLAGGGGTLVLMGEAGMGKSHLADTFRQKAEGSRVNIFAGSGDAIEQLTPYFAWRTIFHELFGLDALPENTAVRREHVLNVIHAAMPASYHLSPLLNVVLPFEIKDNEWTEHMSGRVRAENIREFFTAVFQRLAGSAPAAIILDDAHWIDSASWGLALAIARQVPNVLFFISMRPDNPYLPVEHQLLLEHPATEKLYVKELSGGDTVRLICNRLGVSSLPEEVSALIWAKAEGHPFFSEELAYAIRDSGLIEIKNGECSVTAMPDAFQSIHFPNSVQGIIASRIDRLPMTEQLILKVASVIGRIFNYSILNGILPHPAASSELKRHLSVLQEVNLTLMNSLEPELTYIFKHVITQEVSYHMMLHSQRRQLHHALAEWYERHFTDLSANYGILAHHWSKAENTRKTVEYLEKAGLQALETGAYQVAVGVFRQLLDTANEEPYETGHVARWHRLLGESYMGIGDMAAAAEHLTQALSLFGRPVAGTPQDFKKHMIKQLAVQLMHRILPSYFVGRAKGKEDRLEPARCYFRLSEIAFFINKPLDNLYHSVHGLNLAEEAGASVELAQITGNMCVTAGIMTLQPLARSYKKQALQVADQIKELSAKAWTSMDISLYHIGNGHWREAHDYAVQSIQIYEKLGDRRYWEASSYLYVKVLAYHHADFAKSASQSQAIYESGKQSGNAQAQSWGLLGQAESMLVLGKIEEARILLEQAETLIPINIGLTEEIRVYSLLALCCLKTNTLDVTQPYAIKALELIEQSAPTTYYSYDSYAAVVEVLLSLWESGHMERQLGEVYAGRALKSLKAFAKVFPIAKPRLQLYRGILHKLNGDPGRARKAWTSGLHQARKLEMPYEEARIHWEIGLHLDPNDAMKQIHQNKALEIFKKLGIASFRQ